MIKINEKDKFVIKIEKILYPKPGQPANGFYIFKGYLCDGTDMPVSVKGNMDVPVEGTEITVVGVPEKNQYGITINSEKVISNFSTDENIAINYLAGGDFFGIGPVYASRLVQRYGTDVPSYIGDKAKIEAAIPIRKDWLKQLLKCVKLKGDNLKTEYNNYNEFYKLDLPYSVIMRISDEYKEQAPTVFKRNPYQVLYDIKEIPFSAIDKAAMSVGFNRLSEKRIEALISVVVDKLTSQNGNCYALYEDVEDEVKAYLTRTMEAKFVYYQNVLEEKKIPKESNEWNNSAIAKLIEGRLFEYAVKCFNNNEIERNNIIQMYNLSENDIKTIDYFIKQKNELDNLLKGFIKNHTISIVGKKKKQINEILNDPETCSFNLILDSNEDGNIIISTMNIFLSEFESAKIINALLDKVPVNIPDKNIKQSIAAIQMEEGHDFEKEQVDAVFNCIKNRVSVITGGPGTGKTTIEKAIIKAWNGETILLAPTGKAAKRMTEATGRPASTIHRFVASNAKYSFSNWVNYLFLVDEFSMVDCELLYTLLTYLPKNTTICFIGDVDQLPSVGRGKVLKDIIDSEMVPVSRLTICHRNEGSIYENAKVVNEGCLCNELNYDANFKKIFTDSENSELTQIIKDTYLEEINTYGIENIMLLCARNKNVDEYNKILQEICNPPSDNKAEIILKTKKKKDEEQIEVKFREGDRIIQTTNNYDVIAETADGKDEIGIFNGEIGTITSIENDNIIVTFDDGKVAYLTQKNSKHLKHAYALTYHKSQGSEAKCVICVLTDGDYKLLQRKIIYTGITRAKKKCYLIGKEDAFNKASANIYQDEERKTTLKKYLQEN